MTPKRILVAEDSDATRGVLCEILRAFGYEVVAVGHGLAAVEAARDGAFDLVLMDCHMPVLDGFDATRAIRAGVPRQPVIIALTGGAARDECLAAGMDDHLTKPVRPALLRETLSRWLDGEGTAAALPGAAAR